MREAFKGLILSCIELVLAAGVQEDDITTAVSELKPNFTGTPGFDQVKTLLLQVRDHTGKAEAIRTFRARAPFARELSEIPPIAFEDIIADCKKRLNIEPEVTSEKDK